MYLSCILIGLRAAHSTVAVVVTIANIVAAAVSWIAVSGTTGEEERERRSGRLSSIGYVQDDEPPRKDSSGTRARWRKSRRPAGNSGSASIWSKMLGRALALAALALAAIFGACESRCGDRLERALDHMRQRRNSAKRRLDLEEFGGVFHQTLRSAPIEVSVTKLIVEIPQSSEPSRESLPWAKVEHCSYEPSSNAIRTRVAFNELAVTGLVTLTVHEGNGEHLGRYPGESCRMSLRLRRAGMEFYTSPIARGRGQMRIRTESSFLEPRFASIYAYGCRAALPGPQGHHSALLNDRFDTTEPRKREVNSLPGAGANKRQGADEEDDGELLLPSEDLSGPEDGLKLLEQLTGDNEKQENHPAFGILPASSAAAMLDSLWRSRNDIAREMEDIFLKSASQSITHYIEKQLHPAIKETLMLSMGYTISYG